MYSNGGSTTSAPSVVASTAISIGVQSLCILNTVVYPIVSTVAVYIDTNVDLSDTSFTIVDKLGKEVHLSSTTPNGALIYVSNLSAGTDIFVINYGTSILRKKVVVIK